MRPEHWLYTIPLRLRSLLRGAQTDQELDDELRDHLEQRTEEYVAQGMTQEEAHRRARLDLGGMEQTKETCRDARRVNWIQDFMQDLRHGLRVLRKSPGFTTVVVLTLALGIGANTAIFSVVYGIVFRPLPYQDASRLVSVWTEWPEKSGTRSHVSLPDFQDWEVQNSAFEKLAAYGANRYDIPDLEGGEGVRGALVTSEFFPLLGVKPFLGRVLVPADDRERVAVLSYGLWRSLYHDDRNVSGRSLRLGEHEYTVIGVMPPSFRLPIPDAEIWLSFADIYASSGAAGVGNWLTDRGLRGYGVLARLKQEVSLAQAQSQMCTLERRLAESYPKEDKGLGVVVVPLQKQITGDVERALLLLMGAVAFVLLIACVNVANLMLTRATARDRETAIRRALGAGSNRLARQILAESGLFGVVGGGIGLVMAIWGVKLFLQLSPHNTPRLQEVRVDGPVQLFALVATLGTSLLFGLAAVLRGSGHRPIDALREGGRGVGDHARCSRMRNTLAVSEIAFATILAIGAGLMLNSFIRLATRSPGFPTDHALTFDIVAPLSRYREPAKQAVFFRQILERIRALPGVKAAGACTSMPPNISQESDTFRIRGLTPMEPEKSPEAWYLPATPGFFTALGLPLIRGREFTDADNADAPSVAIINLEIAKRYFAQSDPLGQKIDFRGAQRSIVGVAGDTTYDGLGAPPGFQIYVPYAQGTFPGLHFAVRTANDPLSQVRAVRLAVRSVDIGVRPTRISTVEQLLSSSIVQPRFYAWILTVFGLVALALSSVGTYGVISYSVSLRTHEIGVRMALGAKRQDVLSLIMGKGFQLTLRGVVLGVAGALLLTRFLETLLYGVRPTDPFTFVAVPLLLAGTALLASYIPARRATRVDPMVALRYE